MIRGTKALALASATLLAFGLMSGCGDGTDSTAGGGTATPDIGLNTDGTVNNPENVQVDPNKLVFWSLFSGGDGAWMDQIIEGFNQSGPAKQVESVELVWADYYTKLATAVAADKGPDIGVSHLSKLPELVAQGIVAPVDDYADQAGVVWDNYPQATLDAITFEGQHYAVPLDTHAEIMYSNADYLAAAGVETNADGGIDITSADDLIDVLTKLKDTVGDGNTALALTNTGDDPYRVWWATYFQMGGSTMVSDDGTEITMDPEIAVDAADFVMSLYTDGYIQPGITDHQKMFQEGKAGLLFGGTWATGAFEQTEGLTFTPQTFPALFNGSDAAWADSHVLIIPTNPDRSDEETQASVDFINYVSSTGGVTWAGSGQIPSDSTVTESQAYLDMPYRSSYMHEKDVAVFPPQTEHFYALKDTMIKNLDTIWSGQVDSTTAITNMIDEMSADLA